MIRKIGLGLIVLTVLLVAIIANASEYNIKGVITDIDMINSTITIKSKNGKEETLKVDEATRITRNWQRRKVIPFNDLKIGSKVKVRFIETHTGEMESKVVTHMRVR